MGSPDLTNEQCLPEMAFIILCGVCADQNLELKKERTNAEDQVT